MAITKKPEQVKNGIRKGKWKQMFCFDRKKKEWINNKMLQIVFNVEINDTRKLFLEIKTFKHQQIILLTTCKDPTGTS
jgi:hypothetical protein